MPAPVNATERVSVESSGGQADGESTYLSVSADGRFVAFVSDARNLVPGDTNNSGDVFVRDRQSGTTERVSVDSSGAQANGGTFVEIAISADGRFVAFSSFASNLVPGDTNGNPDVFVHDRQTGTTERVSVDSSGTEEEGLSLRPAISADGRLVTFFSNASNLVPGDTNQYADVFVHDRQTGTTERVSVDSSGAQGDGASYDPVLSADGRFIAFGSSATNLVAGDTNGVQDVFVHDRQTGTTERVSVDSSGSQGNNGSVFCAINADGRVVSFDSAATNLVAGDTNRTKDVFVHDRQTGTTERLSVDSSGGEVKGLSVAPSISGDGRFVAFVSDARKLVPGDRNHLRDVFVHDRQTGRTTRASVDSFGAEANGSSSELNRPAISSDGVFVAFASVASNLVAGDTNAVQDVFVRHRRAPIIDSFTPTSGITGSKVTISGDNLDTTTKVKFNGMEAKFKILSLMTQIQATVPDGATNGRIAVENLDGTANSTGDYAVSFSIVQLSPTSGPVGTVVTLTGVGFSDVTRVKFHRVSAAFTVLSPSSIRATVPTGVTTGKVTSSSPQGTVTGPKFAVTP